MRKQLIPMNLQFFGEDAFVDRLSEVLGVSAETKEVAEPSSTEIATDANVADEQTATETKAIKETKERNLDKDSAFAAQRREKEAIERKLADIEAQRVKEQAERDEWYKTKFSQYGITSEAEYRKALEKQEEESLKEKAVEGDSDAIEALIKSGVDKVIDEERAKAQNDALFALTVERELGALNEEFGVDFKTLADLKASPNGSITLALMGTKKDDGSFLSAKEAYRMANVDTLLTTAKEKVKQEVLNKANGFNHTKVDQKPTGELDNITLDAETLAFYDKMGIKPNMDHIKRVRR